MNSTPAQIADVITELILVFIGDALTKSIYPPPLGLNYRNKNIAMDFIPHIPISAFIIMASFFLFRAFAGGILSGLIVGRLVNGQKQNASTISL
jgi:hypothetical protein